MANDWGPSTVKWKLCRCLVCTHTQKKSMHTYADSKKILPRGVGKKSLRDFAPILPLTRFTRGSPQFRNQASLTLTTYTPLSEPGSNTNLPPTFPLMTTYAEPRHRKRTCNRKKNSFEDGTSLSLRFIVARPRGWFMPIHACICTYFISMPYSARSRACR